MNLGAPVLSTQGASIDDPKKAMSRETPAHAPTGREKGNLDQQFGKKSQFAACGNIQAGGDGGIKDITHCLTCFASKS